MYTYPRVSEYLKCTTKEPVTKLKKQERSPSGKRYFARQFSPFLFLPATLQLPPISASRTQMLPYRFLCARHMQLVPLVSNLARVFLVRGKPLKSMVYPV